VCSYLGLEVLAVDDPRHVEHLGALVDLRPEPVRRRGREVRWGLGGNDRMATCMQDMKVSCEVGSSQSHDEMSIYGGSAVPVLESLLGLVEGLVVLHAVQVRHEAHHLGEPVHLASQDHVTKKGS
jgi:hypothetical protein